MMCQLKFWYVVELRMEFKLTSSTPVYFKHTNDCVSSIEKISSDKKKALFSTLSHGEVQNF